MMKAAATRAKNRTPAMEISRRASWGKGITAMRTVPTATSANTGSRTRLEPEKPMGSAVPGHLRFPTPSRVRSGLEGLAHRLRAR